jgi:Putative polyhydroxyalkanoic acid system protein (PHA_gran_rgn)
MKHSVPHDLSLAMAKKAADAALQSYKARFAEYDPQITWVNDRLAEVTFRAKGMSMKGSFEIKDNAVDMDMDVPLLLRPFKNKALEVIEEQIKKWIDKARTGELT